MFGCNECNERLRNCRFHYNRQIDYLNFIRVWNLFRQYSHLYTIVATIRLLLLCSFYSVFFSIPNGAHSNALSHRNFGNVTSNHFYHFCFNKRPYYSLTTRTTAHKKMVQKQLKWTENKVAKDFWYFEQFWVWLYFMSMLYATNNESE